MNETLWEDENVSFVKDLGDEAVVRIRGHEAYIKCSLQDGQYLCGTGVGVGRIETIWGIINAS